MAKPFVHTVPRFASLARRAVTQAPVLALLIMTAEPGRKAGPGAGPGVGLCDAGMHAAAHRVKVAPIGQTGTSRGGRHSNSSLPRRGKKSSLPQESVS